MRVLSVLWAAAVLAVAGPALAAPLEVYGRLPSVEQVEISPDGSNNWIEYLKFRHEERRSWNAVDGCVLTSQREKDELSSHAPDKPTMVVPNGVDIDYFRPTQARTTPGSIVFTGLMRYRPNVDGVIYFTQRILPHIVRQRPDVTFTIVGMGPPKEVVQLAGPNVQVTGAVPDVRPYA